MKVTDSKSSPLVHLSSLKPGEVCKGSGPGSQYYAMIVEHPNYKHQKWAVSLEKGELYEANPTALVIKVEAEVLIK